MARIQQGGRVRIPPRICKQLDLQEGTELELTVANQEIRLRKRPAEDPLDQWTGAIELPTDVDTFIDDLRGDV